MSKDSAISVLLVEDNADHAELIRIAFQREAIESELVHLSNGEQAVSYLSRLPPFEDVERPDLVLMDLKMPKLGGLETLEFIRSHDTLGDLPVVILTSSIDPADLDQVGEHRPDAYLVKPVAHDALSTLLRDLGLRVEG